MPREKNQNQPQNIIKMTPEVSQGLEYVQRIVNANISALNSETNDEAGLHQKLQTMHNFHSNVEMRDTAGVLKPLRIAIMETYMKYDNKDPEVSKALEKSMRAVVSIGQVINGLCDPKGKYDAVSENPNEEDADFVEQKIIKKLQGLQVGYTIQKYIDLVASLDDFIQPRFENLYQCIPMLVPSPEAKKWLDTIERVQLFYHMAHEVNEKEVNEKFANKFKLSEGKQVEPILLSSASTSEAKQTSRVKTTLSELTQGYQAGKERPIEKQKEKEKENKLDSKKTVKTSKLKLKQNNFSTVNENIEEEKTEKMSIAKKKHRKHHKHHHKHHHKQNQNVLIDKLDFNALADVTKTTKISFAISGQSAKPVETRNENKNLL